MQGRSWMAALTLAAGLLPATCPAGEPTGAGAAKAQTVRLVVSIRGVGKKGCEVEVKPGHPGCRFQPFTRTLPEDGVIKLDLHDVVIQNADRDCTFAITVREPGQAERTVRRGLRVSPLAEKDEPPTLACFISSPSRIARAGEGPSPKR